MADKKLTDPDVIEQIRASLPVATNDVAGLMSSGDKRDQFISMGLRKYEVKNADDATENGIYRFNAGYEDAECVRILGERWGVLLNFVAYPNQSKLQIFMSTTGLIAMRQVFNGQITGVSWVKITP